MKSPVEPGALVAPVSKPIVLIPVESIINYFMINEGRSGQTSTLSYNYPLLSFLKHYTDKINIKILTHKVVGQEKAVLSIVTPNNQMETLFIDKTLSEISNFFGSEQGVTSDDVIFCLERLPRSRLQGEKCKFKISWSIIYDNLKSLVMDSLIFVGHNHDFLEDCKRLGIKNIALMSRGEIDPEVRRQFFENLPGYLQFPKKIGYCDIDNSLFLLAPSFFIGKTQLNSHAVTFLKSCGFSKLSLLTSRSDPEYTKKSIHNEFVELLQKWYLLCQEFDYLAKADMGYFKLTEALTPEDESDLGEILDKIKILKDQLSLKGKSFELFASRFIAPTPLEEPLEESPVFKDEAPRESYSDFKKKFDLRVTNHLHSVKECWGHLQQLKKRYAPYEQFPHYYYSAQEIQSVAMLKGLFIGLESDSYVSTRNTGETKASVLFNRHRMEKNPTVIFILDDDPHEINRLIATAEKLRIPCSEEGPNQCTGNVTLIVLPVYKHGYVLESAHEQMKGFINKITIGVTVSVSASFGNLSLSGDDLLSLGGSEDNLLVEGFELPISSKGLQKGKGNRHDRPGSPVNLHGMFAPVLPSEDATKVFSSGFTGNKYDVGNISSVSPDTVLNLDVPQDEGAQPDNLGEVEGMQGGCWPI